MGVAKKVWGRCAKRGIETCSWTVALCLPLGLKASAQVPLSGTWVAVSETLANGEQNKDFFELHQTADELKGKFHSLGWGAELKGVIQNGKFKLYAAYDPEKVFAEGLVDGSNLDVTMNGNQKLVMKPATPSDDPKAEAIIPPPALHTVPSNGLAKTPPMGWNSWNRFAGGIDDGIVREVADAMVSSGMRDAGYVYLNIDDTWEGVRDKNGVLQPNHKFPDMKALADYVHSKGLKLGIYSSPGPRTCGAYPGSYGHEELDASTWAGWGIDYVKYDWCSASTIYSEKDLQPVYQRMGDALRATGRPMVYSLCEYGEGHVEKWGEEVGANLWRTTGDIRDEYRSMMDNGTAELGLSAAAGPGHWNDPDMLEVGNGKMSDDEYRTHMSFWAILAAPLLAGNDVRHMTDATKLILLNRDVISVNQDALGMQGKRLLKNADVDLWARPLTGGDVALAAFNRGDAPKRVTVNLGELKMKNVTHATDLWTHKPAVFVDGAYTAEVPAHGVLMLRLEMAK